MPVLNFKYVVFSFSFISLPIGSDFMISMLTIVECLEKKDGYGLIMLKYKILETFTTK